MLFLAFELSLFAAYIILFNILEVKNPFEKPLENPVVQLAKKEKVQYPKEANSSKMIAPQVKVAPEKNKLETALVEITPNSPEDIVHVMDEGVKPIIYTKSIPLSKLSIQNKKQSFIDMIVPSILIVKRRICQDRERVIALINQGELSKEERVWLTKKRHIFKAKDNNELYKKMGTHPTSIVVAQAIIESGWGTSRFFEQANNLFGVWSFTEHEERMEANESRGEQRVYLRKYTSIEQSINDYFILLSTQEAYQAFRDKRLRSQNPFELIQELDKYSELGDVYIRNLKETIEKNGLELYDSYHLDL